MLAAAFPTNGQAEYRTTKTVTVQFEIEFDDIINLLNSKKAEDKDVAMGIVHLADFSFGCRCHEGLKKARRLLGRYPKNAYANYYLGELSFSEGNFHEAMHKYSEVVSNSNPSQDLFWRAKTSRAALAFQRREFAQVIAEFVGNSKDPRFLKSEESVLLLAYALQQQKDDKAMLSLLERADANLPNKSTEFKFALAVSLFANNRLTDSRNLLEAILAQEETASAFLLYSEILLQEGDLATAKVILSKAQKAFPENEEVASKLRRLNGR